MARRASSICASNVVRAGRGKSVAVITGKLGRGFCGSIFVTGGATNGTDGMIGAGMGWLVATGGDAGMTFTTGTASSGEMSFLVTTAGGGVVGGSCFCGAFCCVQNQPSPPRTTGNNSTANQLPALPRRLDAGFFRAATRQFMHRRAANPSLISPAEL